MITAVPILLIISAVLAVTPGTGVPAHPNYPNELPGFKFHATAK